MSQLVILTMSDSAGQAGAEFAHEASMGFPLVIMIYDYMTRIIFIFYMTVVFYVNAISNKKITRMDDTEQG